jgi:hypothetical protein
MMMMMMMILHCTVNTNTEKQWVKKGTSCLTTSVVHAVTAQINASLSSVKHKLQL